MNVTGAILAGGRSRRMGHDKLSLDFGGVPLVSRVYRALEPNCDELLVVGTGQVSLPLGVRRVPDARPGGLGPLAGIETALLAARHRAVFVAAGDMPFVTVELVGGLLEFLAEGRAPAVVPRHEGRVHPLCGAYDRDGALPAIGAALGQGELAVRDMLVRLTGVLYVGNEELRNFGNPELMLLNVNSPGDLDRARAILRSRHGGES